MLSLQVNPLFHDNNQIEQEIGSKMFHSIFCQAMTKYVFKSINCGNLVKSYAQIFFLSLLLIIPIFTECVLKKDCVKCFMSMSNLLMLEEMHERFPIPILLRMQFPLLQFEFIQTDRSVLGPCVPETNSFIFKDLIVMSVLYI